MRAVLLAAALVLVSAAANAQAVPSWPTGMIWASGNDMKAHCHSANVGARGLCVGFAMAVAGIMGEVQVAGGTGEDVTLQAKFTEGFRSQSRDRGPMLLGLLCRERES